MAVSGSSRGGRGTWRAVDDVFRQRAVWISLLVSLVLTAVVTFAYIGAYIDPDAHLHKLPLAVANEDQGATIDGRGVSYGATLLRDIVTSTYNGHQVAWTVLPNRDAIVSAMNDNRYYAALVIPPNFSQRVAAFRNSASLPTQSATLEVLTNQAAGSIAYSTTRDIATGVGNAASKEVALPLLAGLRSRHASIPLSALQVVATPIQVVQSNVEPLPTRSAGGLAPLYVALVLALTAFMGGQLIRVTVLGMMAARAAGGKPIDPLAGWIAQLVLVLLLAGIGSAIHVGIAVGLLGMGTSSVGGLILFGFLSIAAIASLALAFLVLLGPGGSLVATLVITIFGVPSSGASFPSQTVPEFFRITGQVLPLGYVADGVRAILYFHGRSGAGLGTAIWVLLVYLAGSIALATGMVLWRRRKHVHTDSVPSTGSATPKPA